MPPDAQRIGIRARRRRLTVLPQMRMIWTVNGQKLWVPTTSIVSPGVIIGELQALATLVEPW